MTCGSPRLNGKNKLRLCEKIERICQNLLTEVLDQIVEKSISIHRQVLP